jgi:hypothetical protein
VNLTCTPPRRAPWLEQVGDGLAKKVTIGLDAEISEVALTLLLDAGKADGSVRSDVDARDVSLFIGYLTRLEQSEWDNSGSSSSRPVSPR